ncbi:MAG: TMEM175 family protein [Eubacterium sp.]
MEKNRLEAFSDGVLAIIITIMILELKQPVGDNWGDFLALWPTLLVYMLSYLFIAIYWVNHHVIFSQVRQVNYPILWCNIVWLFVMSFIPFTTEWIGTHPSSFAPVCLYFADLLLSCLSFHLMVYLIACKNGTAKQFKLSPRNIVSIITYALAACFGGFCPIVAYIIVALVSGWWIFPEKKKG